MRFSPKAPMKGFTLIELLIVVAIIAILAAIAVPNFLEAQVRSKVARVKSDLRCSATALEAYYVDYNRYPNNAIIGTYSILYLPNNLTTPISYMTAGCLIDVFREAGKSGGTNPIAFTQTIDDWVTFNSRYVYLNTRQWIEDAQSGNVWVDGETGQTWTPRDYSKQGFWYTASYGPDLKYGPEIPRRGPGGDIVIIYDPTNGTVSRGDVVRTQRDPEGKGVE